MCSSLKKLLLQPAKKYILVNLFFYSWNFVPCGVWFKLKIHVFTGCLSGYFFPPSFPLYHVCTYLHDALPSMCVSVFNPSLAAPSTSDSPQTTTHLLCEAVPGFYLPSSANTQLTVKSGLNTRPSAWEAQTLMPSLYLSLFRRERHFI